MNTIIEKIRAEIKIRLSDNGAFDEEGDSAWHYDQGMIDAYNYILSFLSDLEKEEKPIEGLEEEIREFVEQEWDGLHDNDGNPLYTADYLEYIARHFAQWQKERDEKELSEKIASAYQLGLADKEKQLMKEAVEGKIGELGFHNAVYMQESKWTNFLDGFKKGDKVRIIIVKED